MQRRQRSSRTQSFLTNREKEILREGIIKGCATLIASTIVAGGILVFGSFDNPMKQPDTPVIIHEDDCDCDCEQGSH